MGNETQLNKSLIDKGLFRSLYQEMFKRIDLMVSKTNMSEEEAFLSAPVMEFFDTISSLETLSDNLKTVNELIDKIKIIFNDVGEGVCLSTIHKAKGLEADNVFILAKSLMPSIYARQEWEVISEENLEYVAITRAKKTLQYIDEEKFKIERSQQYEKKLIEKFYTIKRLLGAKTMGRKTNAVIKKAKTGETKTFVANNTKNDKGKKAVGALKFGSFLRK